MSSKWEKLHLSQHGAPTLIYRYAQTATGYEVSITDLTYIWSEQLNPKDILKRADEDGTTIDPSEDTEQFKVLLQKIGEALRSSPGSSITLENGQKDSLQLTTSTKLPAPLKPLKWTLYLSKQPISSTTSHLLLPLLKEEADWQSRQRSLMDQLKQKDWVLGKLFDKIEGMGVDLSTVFPGVSGLRTARKGTSISQASKYIKGAAPFEEEAWLEETKSSGSGLASNIITEIESGDFEELAPAPEKWWEELVASSAPAISQPKEAPSKPGPSGGDMDMDTDTAAETDDEFERQETPPALKRQDIEKSHTPSEKAPEPSKSPSPRKQVPAKKPKGMGVIGGKKQAKKPSPPQDDQGTDAGSGSDSDSAVQKAPTPPPKQKPSTQPKKGLGVIGGKKAEKQSTPTPTTQPPSSSQPPPSTEPEEPESKPKPKRSGKLGVIGGKKAATQQHHPPSPQPQTELEQEQEPEEPKPKPKRPGKLGVIGGKKEKTTTQPTPRADSSDKPKPKVEPAAKAKSPSPVPKKEVSAEPEPEPEEETEQERADKKRVELKRSLEAKSKAPAKKKRRF